MGDGNRRGRMAIRALLVKVDFVKEMAMIGHEWRIRTESPRHSQVPLDLPSCQGWR